MDGTSTNQSYKALQRIPLIAPYSVHFYPISEPNHLKYHKIRVGILFARSTNLGGAHDSTEEMVSQRKVREKEQREEQNAMNYRKRQKRPGLAS